MFNTEYFNNINTKEKAFILGFIYGDGNINIDTRTIVIFQKYDTILNYILDKVESDRCVITSKRGEKYIRLCSKKLAIYLSDIFNGRLKKDRVSLPELPYEYIRYFILGLFEADGSNIKSNKYIQFSVNKNIGIEFKNLLEEVFEEEFIAIDYEKYGTNIYQIRNRSILSYNNIISKMYSDIGDIPVLKK